MTKRQERKRRGGSTPIIGQLHPSGRTAKMIDINKLTFKQIQQLRSVLGAPLPANASHVSAPDPYEIGKNYFVRTVTHHFVGTLVAVFALELQFANCSWVPEDGRFMQAMEKGELSEVEPYPRGSRPIIGRTALIDCVVITWPLPSAQK